MTVISKDEGYSQDFLSGILKYIRQSPSPYHASRSLCDILDQDGFRRLNETDDWNLAEGDRCYVTRNGTSVIAFRMGQRPIDVAGMRLVGAHLDSPCLKLNPNPIVNKFGYWVGNVEVYGSPLLRTWFDRDLSVAGRIIHREANETLLIDCKIPLAVIPSIAIHLDREANTTQKIDSQIHMNPVILRHLGLEDNQSVSLLANLLQAYGQDVHDILSFDLRLYDVNPPILIGADEANSPIQDTSHEFSSPYISSARIDNLLSCYAGVRALLDANDENFCLLLCSDHEEVGSVSDSGAQGNFLEQVLGRIGALDPRVTRRSVLVSADGAHGLHPNYPDKHDEQHRPILNQGPVIKINSNQRYATSDQTEALIRSLCAELQIPIQVFVSKNNMPCGTTIGPLVASEVGIRTVDVGVAQFAMHSIRELAGCGDAVNFRKLLTGFYNTEFGMFSE